MTGDTNWQRKVIGSLRLHGETADTCLRCGRFTLESDFKNDPRWGRVCIVCQNELLKVHGKPNYDNRR